ncbi:MAG: glycine/sarcosine/betaine reductase complex component C subunit alpha [Desulfobaccales bacterium]
MMDKRQLIGRALGEITAQARSGGLKVRVGLMASGSELGTEELLRGAALAMAQDSRIQVVAIGSRVPGCGDLDWIETPPHEADIAAAMEAALLKGRIAGAVALHYPFPVGVTTIGRVLTPARGRPLIVASCTGTSATCRPEAMLRNAVYGVAVAKALGNEDPSVGIVNLDGAGPVQRALSRMAASGYKINFGRSVRTDGGALLRGNDLLAGAVDVCVCDTLTGNLLVKLFAAFSTGGSYETLGWGYGPSVGENWRQIVSIISRVSGAPVIGNALCYTAALVRGNLLERLRLEIAAAKACGLADAIASLAPKPPDVEAVAAPPREPTDAEIHGVDVLAVEAAVRELWKSGIWAEPAMGCTGPVVRVSARELGRSEEALRQAGYL